MANGMKYEGITLDSEMTKDIDDGFNLSFDGNLWHLTVAVADVAQTIYLGSSLDQHAREMTVTRYFAAGNSPMLPRRFSEDKLSLWPGEDKKALVMKITFNQEFNLTSFDVERALFESKAKLSYSQVPDFIKKGGQWQGLFQEASKLALGLLHKRRAAGAMVLYDLNNGWYTTEEGSLKKIEKHEETIGYIIIQEFMIATNAALASWCVHNKVPILFRNHSNLAKGPTREELMAQLQDAFLAPMPNLDQVRKQVHHLMERAEYGPQLKGHYGLNVAAYMHATSPIRRYADLINHRQVTSFLKKEEFLYTEEALQKEAEHINGVDRELRDSQSAYMKERHENYAQKVAHDARRIHGLNNKDFERVLKVQTRSGEPPTTALLEAFDLRLWEHKVPPVCLAVGLIFPPFPDERKNDHWRPLREMILAYVAQHPHHGPTIATQGSQICGWPEVTYGVDQEGPPHEPKFTVAAAINFSPEVVVKEGREFMGEYAYVVENRLNSKEARIEACVGLLAFMYGLPEPEVVFSKKKTPPPQPKKKDAGAFNFNQPDRDPISVLHEYCQARGIALPEYSFNSEGPPHNPTITCTCKLQDTVRKASSQSKKDAKREAVKAVIAALS